MPLAQGGQRHRAVAQAVVTLNSNHITNLPEVVTAAATAAFDGPQDVRLWLERIGKAERV